MYRVRVRECHDISPDVLSRLRDILSNAPHDLSFLAIIKESNLNPFFLIYVSVRSVWCVSVWIRSYSLVCVWIRSCACGFLSQSPSSSANICFDYVHY